MHICSEMCDGREKVMRFIDRLEKRFGRFAVQNISLYLLICYAFGYAIGMVNSDFLRYLWLDPTKVLQGQVWRVFTWILVPPERFDLLTLIMLYFYYSIGTTLERTWGTFRYNLFLFTGMLFTVIGSFLAMAYLMLTLGADLDTIGAVFELYSIGAAFNTFYVNMSIFLAFAMTFPESSVLLFFIIPIKMKVMGIVYGALLAYQFFASGAVGRIIIVASLLNVLIFFLLSHNMTHLRPKQIKRRMEYKRDTQPHGITRHKCAICGRTELDGDLSFRFCSKCNGNYEYCQDHLFTHEHVR